MTRFYTILLSVVLALSVSCSSTSSQQQPTSAPIVWTPGQPTLEQQLQLVEELNEWTKLVHFLIRTAWSHEANEGLLKLRGLLAREKIRLQKTMEMEAKLEALAQIGPCLPSSAFLTIQGLPTKESHFLYWDVYLPISKTLQDQANKTVLLTDINSVLDVILPENETTCSYSACSDLSCKELKPEARKIIRQYATKYQGRIVIKPKLAKAAGLNLSEVSRHYPHENQ